MGMYKVCSEEALVDVHFVKQKNFQVKLTRLTKEGRHELTVGTENIQDLHFEEGGTITYQTPEETILFKLDLGKMDSVFQTARGEYTGKETFRDQMKFFIKKQKKIGGKFARNDKRIHLLTNLRR